MFFFVNSTILFTNFDLLLLIGQPAFVHFRHCIFDFEQSSRHMQNSYSARYVWNLIYHDHCVTYHLFIFSSNPQYHHLRFNIPKFHQEVTTDGRYSQITVQNRNPVFYVFLKLFLCQVDLQLFILIIDFVLIVEHEFC